MLTLYLAAGFRVRLSNRLQCKPAYERVGGEFAGRILHRIGMSMTTYLNQMDKLEPLLYQEGSCYS
jgi:hypothetical protein